MGTTAPNFMTNLFPASEKEFHFSYINLNAEFDATSTFCIGEGRKLNFLEALKKATWLKNWR